LSEYNRLGQGDWAGYGEEVKKLGEVLNRLASTPQAAGNK